MFGFSYLVWFFVKRNIDKAAQDITHITTIPKNHSVVIYGCKMAHFAGWCSPEHIFVFSNGGSSFTSTGVRSVVNIKNISFLSSEDLDNTEWAGSMFNSSVFTADRLKAICEIASGVADSLILK